jgi:phosphatidate cytidylyltransferase
LNLKALATRSLVAVILGPLIILAALQGGLYWLFFVLLVVTLSLYEFYKLATLKSAFGQLIIGETGGVLIIISFYLWGESAIPPILLITLMAISFVELYRKKASPTLNASVTLFGILHFSLLFGSLVLIREIPRPPDVPYSAAGRWIVMVIGVTWICDTVAYLFGSSFGVHKVMPRISPKKTVEGCVAGFLSAIVAAYLCTHLFVRHLTIVDVIVIGAIVGLFGQYGDLIESMFKRDAGVKDTSAIIPGHGGIMDRFDSLTLSAPLVYLYLRCYALGM